VIKYSNRNTIIVGDLVGSGKSYYVLAIIAINPIVKNIPYDVVKCRYTGYDYDNCSCHKSLLDDENTNQNFVNIANDNYFTETYDLSKSHRFNKQSTTLIFDKDVIFFNSNLIIVPYSIINQWISYISQQTTLTFIKIKSKENIKSLGSTKDGIINSLNSVEIILLSSTMYADFFTYLMSFGIDQKNKEVENSECTFPYDFINKFKNELINFVDEIKKSPNIDKELMKKRCKKLLELNEHENINALSSFMSPTTNIVVSGYAFQRKIIDEIDSIKIKNYFTFYGKWNWYVTSSIENLLNPENAKCSKDVRTEIKETIGYQYVSCLTNFVINNRQFIKYSENLTVPKYVYVSIETPKYIDILYNYLPKNVINCLNASNIIDAVQLIGCQYTTNKNLVDIIKKKMDADLQSYNQNLIQARQKLVYLTTAKNELKNKQDKIESDRIELASVRSKCSSAKKSIITINDHIQKITSDIVGIETKMNNVEKTNCQICLESIKNLSLSPCCNSNFCLGCICKYLDENLNKCPICAQHIKPQQLISVVNSDVIDECNTKIGYLTNKILTNKDKRFLLFTDYENTFDSIINNFKRNDISFAKVSGSSSHIEKVLKDFTDKKYQVLLLNAQYFGTGLNIQMADEIILYHRMTSDKETQIIGRAQRIGRETRLTVNYLCYNNEMY
jgi:hypothetical protein